MSLDAFTTASPSRADAARAAAAAWIGVAVLGLAGCCLLLPEGVTVDPPFGGDLDANSVLEPGEAVEVEPAWHRSPRCTQTSTETGKATTFTGPPGGIYTILDDTAGYGTFTTRAGCASTGNCYRLSVSAAVRPVSHWDASFLETLHPILMAKHVWTLHVGESYDDVPKSHPAYREVETMLHKGVTAGCTPTEYCPERLISRAEAATFVARAYYRQDSSIPTVSDPSSPDVYRCVAGGVSLFEDVSPIDPFCKHIHALARSIDVSCAPARFCPTANMDRGTMARLVAEFGPGQFAVPSVYGPDPATGRSYSCVEDNGRATFSDLGPGDPLCAPVCYLWAKGVVDGCSATEFCPASPVTRASAAVFVVDGFGLQLYDGEGPRALPNLPCGTDIALCTRDDRFAIQAVWKRPDGSYGPGHAVPISSESGYFWFFEAGNVEVIVKTPDGCGINGHEWFFAAGLTNLDVELRVTDRATGEFRTYVNPQGGPFRTITDTGAFASCSGGGTATGAAETEASAFRLAELGAFRPDASPGCVAGDTALCLDGRFRIEADWRTESGDAGRAHAVALTPEAGYFWFFDPSNVELVAKVVDACGIGQGHWFFAGGMTTIGVELRVTDTLTGETRTHLSPVGQTFAPVEDTSSFSVCATSEP
jgi:S-layer homology domain